MKTTVKITVEIDHDTQEALQQAIDFIMMPKGHNFRGTGQAGYYDATVTDFSINQHCAIHCPTVQDFRRFFEICSQKNICWGDSSLIIMNEKVDEKWNSHKENTICVIINGYLFFGNKNHERNQQYRLITLKDFLYEPALILMSKI